MAIILVDTDVFTYLTSTNSKHLAPFKPHLLGSTLVVSFITVGEQYAGYRNKIQKNEWPESSLQKLEERLRQFAVIPFDVEICRVYGNLKYSLKNPDGSHRVIEDNDLWIAATALHHSLRLATNNRKHFQGIPGLELVP
jgi:predicted nucleic acid-binding protein